MESPKAFAALAPHEERPPVRRATRDLADSVLGGVASGVAGHLAVPAMWIRVAFVAMTALGGFGVILYAALWALMPAGSEFDTDTPGAESATRGGRRPGAIRRIADAGPEVALVALGVGVVFVLEVVFGFSAIFWPLMLAGCGAALIWRQADQAQRDRWFDSAGRLDPVRVLVGHGWQSWVRIGAGILLLVVAAVYVAVMNDSAVGLMVTTVLVLAGLGIVVAPLVARLARDLAAERDERIRSQERADVAAHLHDSVLQTLAMIQKSAGDSAAVAKLARSQERELRAWLYADTGTGPESIAGALRAIAAEAEDTYGLTVDLVTVGDCAFEEGLRPVVAAAREALTNVAKHAQTTAVSVYAEVSSVAVEVFIRDRGAGFDRDAVRDDRHGIVDSIVGRMERHGGRATIRSTPGLGTEVQLAMNLAATRPVKGGRDDVQRGERG